MPLLFQCLDGPSHNPLLSSHLDNLGQGWETLASRSIVQGLEGETTVSNPSVMSPQEMNSCLQTGILIQGSLIPPPPALTALPCLPSCPFLLLPCLSLPAPAELASCSPLIRPGLTSRPKRQEEKAGREGGRKEREERRKLAFIETR